MDRVLGTEITLNRIGLKPSQRVLEIGPGPGRLLIHAAKRVLPGGEVIGLDIQLGMIKRLKAHVTHAGILNVTKILGNATRPNVLPESFDVVFLCTMLGEILDRETGLRECYKALEPGGILSITEIFPDPHYQSRATVKRLAEATGFHLRATYGPWYFFMANFVKS